MEEFEREANVTWVREHFSELLDEVRRTPVRVVRHGRAAAVMVSPEFYERAMEALEDDADIEAVRAWREDPGPRVTSSEVLKRLERLEGELAARRAAE